MFRLLLDLSLTRCGGSDKKNLIKKKSLQDDYMFKEVREI
jgi:hypothetical protein